MKEKTIRVHALQEGIHVPFVLTALTIAVCGGFLLAVILPLEAALGHITMDWLAYAQVHGHLQVLGFAGLFVVGMAYRLAPRFGGGTLALPGMVLPVWALLTGALILRALGQPLAAQRPFAAMLVAGLLLELAGAAVFALQLLLTLAPALRARLPHALLLASAGVWLAVQAALGAWWLGALARDGQVLLPATRATALIDLQLFGFLLAALLGVGTRSFPTLLGSPTPSPRAGLAAAALLNAGLALWTAAAIAADRGAEVPRLAAAGQAGVGLAILTCIVSFGIWRRGNRLAGASRGLAWALRPALLWLALTGLGLTLGAGQAIVDGRPVPFAEADALRHLFALGVVTLAIVAMAQLILPEFASERLVARPSEWRGAVFGATLSAAALLRGLLPWWGVEGTLRHWLYAVAGALGLAAVGGFAGLYVRARHRHDAYLARLAARRGISL